MKFTPAIKVCRVKTASAASFLSALGIDYVGLHVTSQLSDLQIRQYSSICRMRLDGESDIKGVLVCKHVSRSYIVRMAELIHPSYIQLHDDWNREDLEYIKRGIRRGIGIIMVVDAALGVNMRYLRNNDEIDFILFDHIAGGTGKKIDISQFSELRKELGNKEFFVAGGVNSGNCMDICQAVSPYGLDIQSSLETPGTGGLKPIGRVLEFLLAVRKEAGFNPNSLTARLAHCSHVSIDEAGPEIIGTIEDIRE